MAGRGLLAASEGVRSTGDALLRILAGQRAEALDRERIATERERLAQQDRQFGLNLEQVYRMGGFEPGDGAPAAPSGAPSVLDRPVDVAGEMQRQGIGMAGGISNPGAALLAKFTGPAPRETTPAAGGGWRYNPAGDPRAVLQDRQQTFLRGEGEAERASREGMARDQNATSVRVANIQDSGATARNNATNAVQREIYGVRQQEGMADVIASTMVQRAGSVQGAIDEALRKPPSPQRDAVLKVLGNLSMQQTSRGVLGIGQGGFSSSVMDVLLKHGVGGQ